MRLATGLLGVPEAFFIFVLGVAVLTLWTKRPLVEGLPAAGISSSGLLLVAFPLSFAVRLHGLSEQGPRLLLFALVIIWVGDTVAYFVGRGIGGGRSGVYALADRAAGASAGHGGSGKHRRTGGRPSRVRV